MRLLQDEHPRARMEMTPIMDVVFLLLVFFVYAFLSMTVQRGVRVTLPRADGAIGHGQNIQIVLTQDDAFLLDGRTPVSADALVEATALRYKTVQLPVVIRADRMAHLGPALEVMAKLKAAGVDLVTYQVEKGK